MLTLLLVVLTLFSIASVLLIGGAFLGHLFETLSREYIWPAIVCWVIFLASFGFLVLYANHILQLWIVSCPK